MIKAVIMDGDGSTVTSDGVLPENLRDLIVANPQIKWIMATGRSLDLLRRLPIIDYISRDTPHIVDGGSRLVKHNGESILDQHLSAAEIELFFSQLDTAKIDFMYYYLDEQLSFIFSEQLDQWHNRVQFSQAKATSDIAEYRQWALSHPPTKLFLRITAQITLTGLNWHQNEHNIDLTAHGVTKGSCCHKLLKLLALTPAEAVFIFNDKNDLPLVEHPQLQEITTIKVGDYLPDTPANYQVANPYQVAAVLAKLLPSL